MTDTPDEKFELKPQEYDDTPIRPGIYVRGASGASAMSWIYIIEYRDPEKEDRDRADPMTSIE